MPRKLSQILVYEADAPDGSAAVSVGGSNDLWAAGVLESAPKFTYDVDRPFKVSLRVKAGSDWGIRGPIDKRLVLHFVYDDGTIKGARIIRIENRDANEIMDVEAMELLRDLTFSQMYRTLQPSENTSTSVFLSRYTTEEVLAEILSSTWNAPSHFQVGTIASKYASETPQVAGEGLTHWEAIELLRSELGCEVTMTWNAADSKWDVNMVEEIGGGTASDRPIHAPTGGTASSRANRIQLDVLTEDTDYFSRIIATAGEPPIGIQYATFEVDSHTDISGARRLFLRGNPILIPDQMVGMYAHESLGNDLQISGSGPASGATLCFIDVDGTTIQTGDVIRFQIAPDILSPYVIDPVREAAGGEKVKLLHFENVVPYNNQFERYLGGASDMSSGTTDGSANWIPDGMELVGGATSAEETQAQYVQHGTSSVKVTCPAVGDGIQTQTMPWIFREELQANAVWVRVIVLSGKVRLTTHLDGDSAGGSGIAIFPDGEEQIEFKELSPGEAGIVFDLGDDVSQPVDINHRLLALEAGTVFILDALTITISRQLQPYRADMGRSALFREAARYIASHGSGDPVYSVTCIDPAHLDAAHEEIEIGTYVELKGQFDVAGGTFNLDTTGRVRNLVEVDDPSTGRIHKQIEVAKKSPDFANRFQVTKQVPKTEEQPPTIRPVEKVVDLISDLGNQLGAAPQPRVFAARRAITGGPVVNAIYISDPDDTSSVADGVLIIAGSDGVRWKLSGQADARHFGAAAGGTTDDRAALSAMDAAAGHNILSRGTYKVDSDITLSSDIVIEPGAVLKPASGVTLTTAGFVHAFDDAWIDTSLGGTISIEGGSSMWQQSATSVTVAANRYGGAGAVLHIEGDRGGTFDWEPSGTVDNGLVFTAANGVWVRQYSGPIDIRWFGVTGSGTETSSLSAAISAALTLGKPLIGDPDEVYTSGKLSFPSANGQSLEMRHVNLKMADSTTGPFFDVRYADKVVLQHCDFDGNKANQSLQTNALVLIWAAQKAVVEDCGFHDSPYHGLHLFKCKNIEVYRNYAYENGPGDNNYPADGINILAANGNVTNNYCYLNNTAAGGGDNIDGDGIQLDTGGSDEPGFWDADVDILGTITLENNQCYNNGRRGIKDQRGNTELLHNRCYGNYVQIQIVESQDLSNFLVDGNILGRQGDSYTNHFFNALASSGFFIRRMTFVNNVAVGDVNGSDAFRFAGVNGALIRGNEHNGTVAPPYETYGFRDVDSEDVMLGKRPTDTYHIASAITVSPFYLGDLISYDADTQEYIHSSLPGGAVVEYSGNQSNRITKFANGWMVLETRAAVNVNTGADQQITLPATFVGDYNVWYSPMTDTAIAGVIAALASGSIRRWTGNSVMLKLGTTNSESSTQLIAVMAMGRWV